MSNRRRPRIDIAHRPESRVAFRAGIDATIEQVEHLVDRDPEAWLNYPGDVRATFRDEKPLGPNRDGELLWPVVVSYDETTDRTRVGLSRIAPPAVAA